MAKRRRSPRQTRPKVSAAVGVASGHGGAPVAEAIKSGLGTAAGTGAAAAPATGIVAATGRARGDRRRRRGRPRKPGGGRTPSLTQKEINGWQKALRNEIRKNPRHTSTQAAAFVYLQSKMKGKLLSKSTLVRWIIRPVLKSK
jgi:hypothetical protein